MRLAALSGPSFHPTPTTSAPPATFMINYRVADLEKMLVQLRGAGVTVEKVRIAIMDGLPGSPTRRQSH